MPEPAEDLLRAPPTIKSFAPRALPAAAPAARPKPRMASNGFNDMVKWIALSALVLLSSGCASVYPQPKPTRPTAVYIADYGIHSSLIIPNGDGRYVEYAFGDWYYAALNHCWPNDALGALLVSAKSTLG